jgi:predicted amidohydrolase
MKIKKLKVAIYQGQGRQKRIDENLEIIRRAALFRAKQEAQLIAVPTALMRPYCRIAEMVVPARAYESQVFGAYVNQM